MEQASIAFPAVAVSRGNSFSVVHEPGRLARCRRLALVNGYYDQLTLYDLAGKAWRVTEAMPPRPLTRWTKRLAKTLYNPRTAVTLRYAPPRPYDLVELKRELTTLIDHDPDDLYDQFVSHDRPKGLILQTTTPRDLIRVAETLGHEEANSQSAI